MTHRDMTHSQVQYPSGRAPYCRASSTFIPAVLCTETLNLRTCLSFATRPLKLATLVRVFCLRSPSLTHAHMLSLSYWLCSSGSLARVRALSIFFSSLSLFSLSLSLSLSISLSLSLSLRQSGAPYKNATLPLSHAHTHIQQHSL